MQDLPEEIDGFTLKRLMHEDGDKFYIYSYESPALHRSIKVYYHEETKEYKLLVIIGLTEFCAIEYISESLAQLEHILRQKFALLIGDLSRFHREHINSIVVDKKIMEWDYIPKLPKQLEGFELFISPAEPVKVINGSYVVIDYCDFEIESNFIIYYNMFRDEFFGEARIRRIPEVTYAYDSSELDQLAAKIEEKLQNTLKDIRQRALAQ